MCYTVKTLHCQPSKTRVVNAHVSMTLNLIVYGLNLHN